MKRTSIIVVIVAVSFALIAFWAVATAANAGAMRASRREWTHGLGSVAAVASHYPTRTQNVEASRLIVYAMPLGIDFTPASKRTPDPALEAAGNYLRQVQARADRTIPEPPAEVMRYLATHATQLDLVRDHLLHADVVWAVDIGKGFEAPLPNMLAHLQLARVLVIRALLSGSSADLHGAWRLSQLMQSRPEMIPQIIGLAIARMINAAAWKLPLPAPAWLAEMDAVDHAWLLARTMQVELWMASVKAPPGWKPLAQIPIARLTNHQRDTAAALLANRACGFDAVRFFDERRKGSLAGIFTPSIASAWRRAFRYRAEREATRNALRIAAGEPVVERSVCSDGTWRFADATLAFSRELPKGEAQESDMPLTLRVGE
ncbi:MAG TPA: hypothetical protein VEK11_24500 [Thermoanaerobaculia bacterium]|nr:hypothetical protein [Thermoanaerobaculia bacterium]